MATKITVGQYSESAQNSAVYRRIPLAEQESTKMNELAVAEQTVVSNFDESAQIENAHLITDSEHTAQTKSEYVQAVRDSLLSAWMNKNESKLGVLLDVKNVCETRLIDGELYVYRSFKVGTWSQPNSETVWTVYNINAYLVDSDSLKLDSAKSYALAVRDSDKKALVCRKGSTNQATQFVGGMKIGVKTHSNNKVSREIAYMLGKPYGVKNGVVLRGDLTGFCHWLGIEHGLSDESAMLAVSVKSDMLVTAVQTENGLTYDRIPAYKAKRETTNPDSVQGIELDEF